MLANVGRASAQGRTRRVGALIAEPAQANFLETFLRERGWIIVPSIGTVKAGRGINLGARRSRTDRLGGERGRHRSAVTSEPPGLGFSELASRCGDVRLRRRKADILIARADPHDHAIIDRMQ
jgi:hypothetical protein